MWVRSDSDTLFNINDASKVEVKSTATPQGIRWTVTANFSRTPDGAKTTTYARNNPDEVHLFRGTEEAEARDVFGLVHQGFASGLLLLDLTGRSQLPLDE